MEMKPFKSIAASSSFGSNSWFYRPYPWQQSVFTIQIRGGWYPTSVEVYIKPMSINFMPAHCLLKITFKPHWIQCQPKFLRARQVSPHLQHLHRHKGIAGCIVDLFLWQLASLGQSGYLLDCLTHQAVNVLQSISQGGWQPHTQAKYVPNLTATTTTRKAGCILTIVWKVDSKYYQSSRSSIRITFHFSLSEPRLSSQNNVVPCACPGTQQQKWPHSTHKFYNVGKILDDAFTLRSSYLCIIKQAIYWNLWPKYLNSWTWCEELK